MTYLRELAGKSLLRRNFHALSIVCGASPSPVVAMTKITSFVVGSYIIGNSSKLITFGVNFLLIASLAISSAAYLAVFVYVPYNTTISFVDYIEFYNYLFYSI